MPCIVRGRRGEGVQITHLLFADDTLVSCEAREDQLTHLCWAVRIRLEKIQKDFLWGNGSLEQKPHLVRWPIVCDDKSKGGDQKEVQGGKLEDGDLVRRGLWSCPLSEVFPSLFALATSKEAWVNEVWTVEGDRRGSWTPTSLGRLMIGSWKKWEAGFFSFVPSKIIWRSCAQPKISFFAWEASWGRVLTLDRLQKKGWVLANRLKRLFCGQEEEGGMAFGVVMLVLGYLED
ncbi:hypothetical protein CK203_006130 [Vitis vinifera]|uniref:Reverse transcriptase zinc-binding domain-containing protein n=1 Tax=Vitis vinifera TaxID=29760 RepID=A0A438K5Z4_VITVI|nr:hypothetical protein CK203_006130 [Vitis vinifera]